MKGRYCLLGILLSTVSLAVAAGGGATLHEAPISYYDTQATQRGAAVFVNYCMGCHSAQYMRYGRLAEDIDVSESQIEEFLIHNDAELSDGMMSAMRVQDGKEWFYQAAPPDLSLVARVRGIDWLYAYMRGFYRDPTRPSGWNNTVFNNVAMPHALVDLQGVFKQDSETKKLTRVSQGRLSEEEYNAMVVDLVAFMAYTGEPSRNTRYKIGYLTMVFLLALLLSTYFLYREYWRHIK